MTANTKPKPKTKKRRDNCFWKSDRWFFILWINGRRQTFKGFTDFEATRRLRDDLRIQIARHSTGLPIEPTINAPLMKEHLERLGLIPKVVSRSLREWALAFIDDMPGDENWQEKKKSNLLRMLDDLGWQTVAEIDIDKANDYISRLTWIHTISKKELEASKSTCRKYAGILRSFGIWLEQKEITVNNPFRRVALPRVKDHERVVVRRALPADQTQRLLDVSGSRAILYLTAMGTGLRANELATLMPSSFDLENACIRQRKTKNGKATTLPIHLSILEPLREFLRDKPPECRVWPGEWWKGAARMLRSDLKRAGIPYKLNGEQFDFHALRHQFSSLAAEAGIDPSTRLKLTRHADLRTMQGYTHIPDAAVVEAMAKIKLPRLNQREDS